MKINNNLEKKSTNKLKKNNLVKKTNLIKKDDKVKSNIFQLKKAKPFISWKMKKYLKRKRSSPKVPFQHVFFSKFNPAKNPFLGEKKGEIKKRYFGLTLKIALSLNNVFVTLVRRVTGDVLFSKHSGMIGYKGSKKKNPYVAGEVLKSLLTDLDKLSIQARQTHVQLHFHQKSPYAYSVIRKIRESKLHVSSVSIMRSREHSLGLRKPKQRRV